MTSVSCISCYFPTLLAVAIPIILLMGVMLYIKYSGNKLWEVKKWQS